MKILCKQIYYTFYLHLIIRLRRTILMEFSPLQHLKKINKFAHKAEFVHTVVSRDLFDSQNFGDVCFCCHIGRTLLFPLLVKTFINTVSEKLKNTMCSILPIIEYYKESLPVYSTLKFFKFFKAYASNEIFSINSSNFVHKVGVNFKISLCCA